MPAVVEIDESNGAVEAVTDGVGSLYLGSIDAPNQAYGANPIAEGQAGMEKWIRAHLVDLGASVSVSGFRLYLTTALTTTLWCNLHTVQATYDGIKKTTYSQPGTFDTRATQALPVVPSNPATANLGIAGSLTGTLSALGRSDYAILQVRPVVGVTEGSTSILVVEWDEAG